jgi:ketosteroid isomerase-like protein
LLARERCDLDALADLTANEAVWHSPIDGAHRGKRTFVEQVRAGFADTDDFATETLSIEPGVDRVVASVRNTGRRESKVLDSRQLLLMRVRDSLVHEVRVVVDDPDAVERFWSDG